MASPEKPPQAIPPGMVIETISVRYEVQIELGNRERATFGASATASIGQGVDYTEAHAALFAHCKRAAGTAAIPLLAKRQDQADSVWAGLPEALRKKYAGEY